VSNYSDEPPRRYEDDYGPRRERRDDGRDHEDYDRRLDRDFGSGRVDSAAARSALNQASGGLFAVALIQLICGGIALAVAPELLGVADEILFAVIAVLGLAVVFAGLGVWARFQPLPPAIIGLVLYILATLLDVVMAVQQNVPQQATRGVVMKIILIIMLARGVSAANKYN